MTQVKGNNALQGDGKPVLQLTEGKKNKAQEQTSEQNPPIKEPVIDFKSDPPKALSVDDLKHRATIIHLLSIKHNELLEKRKSLDCFEIKHDNNNAEIVVTDANGEEFRSHSPKSISQLIDSWKIEFDEAIQRIEVQLKQQFVA